jgi:hypothetical protein
MNAYQNNGTRTIAHIFHPSFGTMEFGWDSSDWLTVCFHSAYPNQATHVSSLFHVFHDKKPMTVEKNMARSIWNGLMAADRGWRVSPTYTNPMLAEQGATP